MGPGPGWGGAGDDGAIEAATEPEATESEATEAAVAAPRAPAEALRAARARPLCAADQSRAARRLWPRPPPKRLASRKRARRANQMEEGRRLGPIGAREALWKETN